MIIALCVSIVAGLLLTPWVRRAAVQFGLVDRPDGRRKLHKTCTPLGGGVAVLLATLIAVGTVCCLSESWLTKFAEDARYLSGLAVAAMVLTLVGLIDDRFGLRGRQKLLGQVFAAGVLVAAGLQIDRVQFFDYRVELGLLAVPLTMCWLLATINAVNLMDGMDGLATSLGIILSLTFAGMAWLGGHEVDALIACALAGALIAFLRFNLPPATMFLGDTGSMLIGLAVGALAVRASLKGPATATLSAALAAWAIPLFDVAMAVVRRKLTGRTIYATDRCHLHHCLLRRGFSHGKVLTWIGALSAATACGALGSVYHKHEMLAVVSAASVIGAMVVSGFFGYAECTLLARRLRALLLSMWPTRKDRHGNRPQLCTHLQGTHSWDPLWQQLTEFANRFDLHTVRLNITLPFLHEEYHGSWQRQQRPADNDLWSTDLPLAVDGMHVGRLKITGTCPGGSVSSWMQELIGGLRPVETQLAQLLDELQVHRQRPAFRSPPNRASASVLSFGPTVSARPANDEPAVVANVV